MKRLLFLLMIGVLIPLFMGCGKYEIVYQEKYGVSEVIMCLVKDTSENELIDIGSKLITENKIVYIYFYSDKSKIKDITEIKSFLDAIPSDGFVAQYTTESGYEKNINKYITKEPKGEVKIILLEEKTRKSKYRWYTYYVENYIDTKETDKQMIEVAKKLPYDGFTEVFFFNDSINAPKLAYDGGWGAKKSQNSWNEKYGKYCVGYYLIQLGYGDFSKGWK